ncbi:MAG: hypothetical protein F4Y45_00535 [Acidobacteria bacterium]|nr:hypothetical protein [Acidobacteriota bacterium]
MIKTQVQLPDALYRDLKRLAATREWSLAETIRRASEQFLARYPLAAGPAYPPWRPPVSDAVGWRGLSHEAVRDAAHDDVEPTGVSRSDEGQGLSGVRRP